MNKNQVAIQLIILGILLVLSACRVPVDSQPTTNLPALDTVIVVPQTISFTYVGSTEEFIDIDNDLIADFRCISEQAGNRANKLIVPIGTVNQIVDVTHILEVGDTVNQYTPLSNRFNFNDFGAGQNAFLDNKHLAVKFASNGCLHYGWIKFSSAIDGTRTSNTPVYYHKVLLSITETGYNRGCEKAAIIQ